MKRSQKKRMKSIEDTIDDWQRNHEKLLRDLIELSAGYSGYVRYILVTAAKVIADYKYEKRTLAANIPLPPKIPEQVEVEDAPQARTLNLKMPGVQS